MSLFKELFLWILFQRKNDFLRNFLWKHIFDFGCGSGRDTKYFLDKGYTVEATDGSMELCKIASEYTGIYVRQMLFEELDKSEKYDGI